MLRQAKLTAMLMFKAPTFKSADFVLQTLSTLAKSKHREHHTGVYNYTYPRGMQRVSSWYAKG